MEIFIFILVLVVIVYLLLKKKKTYSGGANVPSRKYKVERIIENNYDNIQRNNTIYNSEYPLFFSLKYFTDFRESSIGIYGDLIKELSNIKSEEIQYAIYQIMGGSWRKRINLPKYLQFVPIDSFINKNILIRPIKSDVPEILESLTFNDLKNICTEYELKPKNNKRGTIQVILNENDVLDLNQYFRLNPQISEIYQKFTEYCYQLLDKEFDNYTLNITKPMDGEKYEIDEEYERFTRRNYSVIRDYSNSFYFKKGKTLLFSIEPSRKGDYVTYKSTPLGNGQLVFVETRSIDKCYVSLVVIFDEKLVTILSETYKNYFGDFDFIDDLDILYSRFGDDAYWIYNYANCTAKILENPNNIDIYSLVQNL